MAAEYVVFEDATSQHYDAAGVLVHDVGARRAADLSRVLPDGWRHVVVWVEDPPGLTTKQDTGEAADEVKVEKQEPVRRGGRGAS